MLLLHLAHHDDTFLFGPYHYSSGFKIDSLTSLLSDNVESPGSLFLRVNEFSVAALASASNIDLTLFPEVSVSGGSFHLGLGFEMMSPFETELGEMIL